MPTTTIGVALFAQSDNSPDPHFSWAIATTTQDSWTEGGEVRTYDIALGTDRKWDARTRTHTHDLSHDSTFCGILELAKTDIPEEDLDEFIRDHPPDDDGWRVYGPAGWSSAMWTLKIMCALEDATIWEIPKQYGADGLFDVVVGKGFVMLELVEEVDEFPVLTL